MIVSELFVTFNSIQFPLALPISKLATSFYPAPIEGSLSVYILVEGAVELRVRDLL